MARIVLVEDNAASRDIFDLYFSRNGHQVRSLADGCDLQNIVTEYRPELILLDLDLGHVSGEQLCQLVRAMPAPYHDTPIVLFSCLDDHSVSDLNLDVNGYICKVDSLAEILRQVNHYLASARTVRKTFTAGRRTEVRAGGDVSEHDVDVSNSLLLNHLALHDLAQDIERSILTEIIEVLIEDMQRRAVEMNRALQDRNAGQLAAQAHALKSSAATYGADQLSLLCSCVTAAFRQNAAERVCEHAQQLLPTLRNTIEALHTYLRTG